MSIINLIYLRKSNKIYIEKLQNQQNPFNLKIILKYCRQFFYPARMLHSTILTNTHSSIYNSVQKNAGFNKMRINTSQSKNKKKKNRKCSEQIFEL